MYGVGRDDSSDEDMGGWHLTPSPGVNRAFMTPPLKRWVPTPNADRQLPSGRLGEQPGALQGGHLAAQPGGHPGDQFGGQCSAQLGVKLGGQASGAAPASPGQVNNNSKKVAQSPAHTAHSSTLIAQHFDTASCQVTRCLQHAHQGLQGSHCPWGLPAPQHPHQHLQKSPSWAQCIGARQILSPQWRQCS